MGSVCTISHWDPSLPIVHTADMSACPCAPVHSQLHTSLGSRGEMERTSTLALETHRWLRQPLVLAWRQDAYGGEQGSKVKQSCWKALFLFFLIAPSVLYHVGMNRAKHSECCPRLQGFSAWKLDLPLWHSSLGVKAVCKCSLVSLSRFYSTGMKVVYFLFLSSDKGEVGICFLQFPIKDFKWCPK